MLITPGEVEKAAKDIIGYWEKSDLSDTDKRKILQMVFEFYTDRNEHNVDQWLAHLTQREIMKNDPELGDGNE